jgi:hypothetical protein
MERNLKLTLEVASKMYKNATNEIRIILENTFPELKGNKYPMSHTELQNILIREKKDVSFIHGDSTIREEYIFTNNSTENKNISIRNRRSRQHLSFIQLVALRDKWNEIDEFEPDWENSRYKYCIQTINNKVIPYDYYGISRILAFKTEETRDLFLKTFRNLIEDAKDFI